jgi:lauroyl/myristoyl acyltransferase
VRYDAPFVGFSKAFIRQGRAAAVMNTLSSEGRSIDSHAHVGSAREDTSSVESPNASDGEIATGIMSLKEHPVPFMTLCRIRFVRGFLFAFMRCFTLSGLYALGYLFGVGEYIIDYRRRRRVRQRLRDYFKSNATSSFCRKYAIRYFVRVRCDKMFYTIMDRIPRDKILNRVELTGIQNIEDARERGNGVYVALCHFGSHHIAGLLMALLGYELAGVRDGRESAVRRYIQHRYTETFPEIRRMKMFAANSFPRGIYRHLQQNKIVASLLDAARKRGATTKTEPVSLFGEERDVLIGPLQIALRCDSVTLQGFIVSKPFYRYEVIVSPPLIDEPGRQGDDQIPGVLKRYAKAVEDFAREHPDHLMNI